MSSLIQISAHMRRKPGPSKAYVKKTEEFYPDLGDMLVGALMAANLAEPLDDPQFDDLSVEDKRRMREAG